jgi:hypothetical protein
MFLLTKRLESRSTGAPARGKLVLTAPLQHSGRSDQFDRRRALRTGWDEDRSSSSGPGKDSPHTSLDRSTIQAVQVKAETALASSGSSGHPLILRRVDLIQHHRHISRQEGALKGQRLVADRGRQGQIGISNAIEGEGQCGVRPPGFASSIGLQGFVAKSLGRMTTAVDQ